MNFHNSTPSAKKRLCCRARAVLAKTMSLYSVIVTLRWQKCHCGLMKNSKQGGEKNPTLTLTRNPTEVSCS